MYTKLIKNTKSNSLIALITMAMLLLISGCTESSKNKHLIYLIDKTIYGTSNMQQELKRELSKYQKIVEAKDHNKFDEIRSLQISTVTVDDLGANSIRDCVKIPSIPGKEYKELKNAISKLQKCFKQFENIGNNSRNYRKSLYIEALNKTLDIIGKDGSSEYQIVLIGDMAIVDESCHLEKRGGCECKNNDKINALNSRIQSLRKKNKISTELIYINIPGEESCQQTRRKIWRKLLLEAS